MPHTIVYERISDGRALPCTTDDPYQGLIDRCDVLLWPRSLVIVHFVLWYMDRSSILERIGASNLPGNIVASSTKLEIPYGTINIQKQFMIIR